MTCIITNYYSTVEKLSTSKNGLKIANAMLKRKDCFTMWIFLRRIGKHFCIKSTSILAKLGVIYVI